MEKRQFLQKKASPGRTHVSPKRILMTGVSLFVLFLLLTSVISLAQKYFTIRKRIRDLKNEHVRLEAKQAKLSATNEYLSTPEGIEQNLRAKFNLVKPGEEMIVVTPHLSQAPTMRTEDRLEGGFWQTILRGLGLRK